MKNNLPAFVGAPSSASGLELFVSTNDLLETGTLFRWHIGRKFRAGPIPFREPLIGEEFVTIRHPLSKCFRGKRDRGLFLFAGTAAGRHVEARREQRRSVGGGTGVSKQFDGSPSASREDFAEKRERPLVARALA